MTGTIKKNVIKRRRVDFELKMPEARQVILLGDFNHWNPKTHPMRKDENGVWRKTMMIYPGRYEYRFVVDGKWIDPPKAKAYVANPYGSRNAIMEV